jgi:hypothetical protein
VFNTTTSPGFLPMNFFAAALSLNKSKVISVVLSMFFSTLEKVPLISLFSVISS